MADALANPAAALAGAWAEPLTFLIMLGCFGLLAVGRQWSIGVALLTAAWLGGMVNGEYLPLRHLIEGAFSYLDPILVIATAMIFMRVLADGGALEAVGRAVERRFGSRPWRLFPVLMLIVMFPGMITGSSTASVLTAGAMVSAIAIGLGLSPERTAAIIAMGGILGMVAPPVNIPAMIIGGGIDLPYAGFDAPLALAAFPPALVLVYFLAWPVLRKGRCQRMPARNQAVGSEGRDADFVSLKMALLPLIVCGILMLAPRLTPGLMADPGLPLTFLAAAAVGVLALPRFGLIHSMMRATEEALPVLSILAGVGAFIQIMTLTGARGWIVSFMVGAPLWAIFAAAALSLPLFGAVSAFGSASVLGVPFLLILLGRDEVVTTAALSQLTALGDLMLPAALAATLAAGVCGVDDRRKVLRLCLLPALLIAATAVLLLVFSAELGRWIG